ncbi:MAG: hypothetical protein KFH87_05390 [Bacteroidetes bacterium]|nr:hypothetical protein [Bacteroidota bacterium]
MEDMNAHLIAVQRVITTQFDLDTDSSEAVVISDISTLRDTLAERITYLLRHDTERLMHILYRVDVEEQVVQETFRAHAPPVLPVALADLIIERQLAKAATHARYRNSSPGDDLTGRNKDAHS